MRLVDIPCQASPIVSMLAVIILADGCTIVGTMARATTTILDLRPSTTSALDLFHKKYNISKGGPMFEQGYINVPHLSCHNHRSAYLHWKIHKDCSYVVGHRQSRHRRRL